MRCDIRSIPASVSSDMLDGKRSGCEREENCEGDQKHYHLLHAKPPWLTDLPPPSTADALQETSFDIHSSCFPV